MQTSLNNCDKIGNFNMPNKKMCKRLPSFEAENDNDMKCSLLDLPNEVLVAICKLLSPLDLKEFGQLNPRLLSVTCEKELVRHVDFRNITVLPPQDLKAFFTIKPRALNISELDLSYCTWIQSTVLEQCISKCKNLMTLHLVNCEVALSSLNRILSHLPCLIRLSWTLSHHKIPLESLTKVDKMCQQVKQIQSVYLEMHDRCSDINVLKWFVSMCENLEELHMYFKSCDYPYDAKHLQNYKISLPKLHSFVVRRDKYHEYLDNYNFELINGFPGFAEAVFEARNSNTPWMKLSLTPATISSLVNMVNTGKESWKNIVSASHISVSAAYSHERREYVNSFFDRAVISSVQYLSLEEVQISEQDLHRIAEIGDTKLKSLCLLDCQLLLNGSALTNLCEKCISITELNFHGTHFSQIDKPCLSIALLKNLRKLALPACAVVRDPETTQSNESSEEFCGRGKKRRIGPQFCDEDTSTTSPLLIVVDGCQQLEELDIRGQCVVYRENIRKCNRSGICPVAMLACTDSDFAVIPKWTKLKSLALAHLPNIRHGKFLLEVAQNCKHLKLLSLQDVGQTALCTYSVALSQALQHASSLNYLRIRHKTLDIASRTLWAAISCVKHLECLCLYSRYGSQVNSSVILSELAKLPHLQILHIHSLVSNHMKLYSQLNKYLSKRNKQLHMHCDVVVGKLEVCYCYTLGGLQGRYYCKYRDTTSSYKIVNSYR